MSSQLVYLKEAFSPDLNETVGTLADNFGSTEGGAKTLNIFYAYQPIWG